VSLRPKQRPVNYYARKLIQHNTLGIGLEFTVGFFGSLPALQYGHLQSE
jgi:hypothetical protein